MFRTVTIAALSATLLSLPLSAEAASCPSGLTLRDDQCVPKRPGQLPEGKRAQGKPDQSRANHGQPDKAPLRPQQGQARNNQHPPQGQPPRSQHAQVTVEHRHTVEHNHVVVKPAVRPRPYNRYKRGDRLPAGTYYRLTSPRRYGLPVGTYYRIGDDIYHVDPDTMKIIAFISVFNALVD